MKDNEEIQFVPVLEALKKLIGARSKRPRCIFIEVIKHLMREEYREGKLLIRQFSFATKKDH